MKKIDVKRKNEVVKDKKNPMAKNIIKKRINNVKFMANVLFDKSHSLKMYRTFNNLWTIRIMLFKCIIVENYN